MTDSSRSRSVLAAFKVLLTLAFVVAGAVYVYVEWEEFRALEWPSYFAILVVAVAFIANLALRALYNVITARRLGTRLTMRESFMLSAVVAAGNLILPVKAGAGVRALYMKKVHRFPISYFASGGLIFLVASVVLVSMAALALLIVIYFSAGYFRLDLVILFPAIMIVSVAGLLLLRGSNVAPASSRNAWIGSFRSSLGTVLGEPKLVASAFVIVSLIFVFSSGAWTIALREYAPDVDIAEAFLLSASQIIAGFVTLTPGAAGFQELAGIYVGRSFSATTAEVFAVLVWVRVVRVAVAVAVAIPSAILLRGIVHATGSSIQKTDTAREIET